VAKDACLLGSAKIRRNRETSGLAVSVLPTVSRRGVSEAAAAARVLRRDSVFVRVRVVKGKRNTRSRERHTTCFNSGVTGD
jgi:hypothetical protein